VTHTPVPVPAWRCRRCLRCSTGIAARGPPLLRQRAQDGGGQAGAALPPGNLAGTCGAGGHGAAALPGRRALLAAALRIRDLPPPLAATAVALALPRHPLAARRPAAAAVRQPAGACRRTRGGAAAAAVVAAGAPPLAIRRDGG